MRNFLALNLSDPEERINVWKLGGLEVDFVAANAIYKDYAPYLSTVHPMAAAATTPPTMNAKVIFQNWMKTLATIFEQLCKCNKISLLMTVIKKR